MQDNKFLIKIDSELRKYLDIFCSEIQEEIKLSCEKYTVCNFQIGKGVSDYEVPYSVVVNSDDINKTILISIIFNVYIRLIENNETILLVLEKMFFQKVDQLIIQWIENTELSRFSIENKYTNQSGEAFKHSSTYSRNLTCNYMISIIA
jgi:hypothetical protein